MVKKTEKSCRKKPWIFNLVAVDFYNEVNSLPARERGKWVTQLADDLIKNEKIQTKFAKRLIKDVNGRLEKAREFGKLGGRPSKRASSEAESQKEKDIDIHKLDQLAKIRTKRQHAIEWFESQHTDFIKYYRSQWGSKCQPGTAIYGANCLNLHELETVEENKNAK